MERIDRNKRASSTGAATLAAQWRRPTLGASAQIANRGIDVAKHQPKGGPKAGFFLI